MSNNKKHSWFCWLKTLMSAVTSIYLIFIIFFMFLSAFLMYVSMIRRSEYFIFCILCRSFVQFDLNNVFLNKSGGKGIEYICEIL